MSAITLKEARDNIRPEEHARGLEAARSRAQWELGDESWADVILNAYFNPLEDAEALREEGSA